MHDGPRVQSAQLVPTEDDGIYEDTSSSLLDNFILGPPLDYFDFEQSIHPYYPYPIAFPPDPALSTSFPTHVAQLHDYTALYNGQPPMDLNPLSLSSKNSPNVPYVNTDPMEPEGDSTPLYGGLPPIISQSGDASGTKATRPVRSRKASKREDPNSISPDESAAARQRGRPRLDTRDQTTAEVSLLGIFQIGLPKLTFQASSYPDQTCPAGVSTAKRDHHLRPQQAGFGAGTYNRWHE